MAPSLPEVPQHTIDRTPEYEEFMTKLKDYHAKRGTVLDTEPKVGMIHLDLLKVFNHIVANGGYDKVSEEKLAWRRMASELGVISNNEASTAFALKEKFYKNLAAYEISSVHGKEPPPKDILEDVTAKGAGLLTRTRENFRGKRESNVGATDSAASGDDGTPVRERPAIDAAASARASRGLREAPPQRVLFQPDTTSSRATRQSTSQQNSHNHNHNNNNNNNNNSNNHNQNNNNNSSSSSSSNINNSNPSSTSGAVANPSSSSINYNSTTNKSSVGLNNMKTNKYIAPSMTNHMPQGAHNMNMAPMPPASLHGNRGGPSIMHHPPNSENTSHLVTSYQPKHLKPLQLIAVATPSNAPNEFQKVRLPHRFAPDPATRQPLQPGTGFDGPNIYTRCLNALRSGLPAEQAFALNHLVKISFERGDKYKFDAFPGLAEGLVEKALQIGSLFYHINWTVSWDWTDSSDIGSLDGNYGTPNILERIQNLVERDAPDALQTESFADEMVLITEAILTIRNMLTLPENAHNMADFPPIKDLVCIILNLPVRDSLAEIKHLGLDIAESLTPFMVLDSDDPLYKTLLAQMTSDDRGTILTALRALARISMNLEATNNLGDIPGPVLQRIMSWLLLNDDELLDACLDFLYQYTAVVANVDHFLRTTIPENLVEQLIRLLAHGARRVTREYTLVPEQRLPARDEIAPMPEDLLEDMLKLEEPERVHQWVKCFFEEDQRSFITQLAAWQAYQSAFATPLKTIGQAMITPADFIRSSTSVYKDSNAQVLREPGDPQQKFIIHGIRARPRPLSFDGIEYGRCLWATNPERKNEKCGHFFLKQEQMWNHILTAHLHEKKGDDGRYGNAHKAFRCTWGECFKYERPTPLHLQEFARHINTHISAMLPSLQKNSARRARNPWVIPAETMTVSFSETPTFRDERTPEAAPQAAGIPLSAVLVLRNVARNVVKTEAEDELVKTQDKTKSPERGGWNERLFRPYLPKLYEILAENLAMSPYIASLLELIRVNIDDERDR